jgi:hypothetical protein
MMKNCPNCNEPFSWTREMGQDYVHQCNSGVDELDTESVLKIGRWTDYTGTGSVCNPQMQGFASARVGKSLENIDSTNIHGKREALYRTRQHLEYIEIKEES